MTRPLPNRYSPKYKLVEVKGISKKTSNDTTEPDVFLTVSSEHIKLFLNSSIPSMRKMKDNLPEQILLENNAIEPLVIIPPDRREIEGCGSLFEDKVGVPEIQHLFPDHLLT